MVQFNLKKQNYNVAIHTSVFKNNKNLYFYAHFQNVIQPATL